MKKTSRLVSRMVLILFCVASVLAVLSGKDYEPVMLLGFLVVAMFLDDIADCIVNKG